MEKNIGLPSCAGKSRIAPARPNRAASKKRPKRPLADKKQARKGTASAKPAGKQADKSARKSKKKSARNKTTLKGSAAIKVVMKRFKDARASDVSDKVFVATSPVHGKGLFAARKIKANTVLGRLHGMPTFDDGTYVLWITDELGLELTNDFKYINHDKDANAAYSDIDVTVLRDVEPGEELLHDYGW